MFIRDIQRGDKMDKTLREYITEYRSKANNNEIITLSQMFGLDKQKLRDLMNIGLTESNINAFGRFDELKSTIDVNKAKCYFKKLDNVTLSPSRARIRAARFIQDFIVDGRFKTDPLDDK